MSLPDSVRIVEVGPRDGLQNESEQVSPQVRTELVERLVFAGLKHIEVGSFVSPKWVPQMADSAKVLAALEDVPDVTYSVLVPNMHGMGDAVEAGAKEIAVFAAASETFSQRNTNCSIGESLERLSLVAAEAARHKIAVRGYVSCVLGCPYEGAVNPDMVASVAKQLDELGCFEISLGDTIGVGTPKAAERLIETVATDVPLDHLAVHFHDTYGQALPNTLVALQLGIATVDTSVGGLGGCPYAPGAAGNVATEEVAYMLSGMGITTGIDLERLLDAGDFIDGRLGRTRRSRVAEALRASANGGG